MAFYALLVETFTFLFTDIEGSTALLGRVGQGVYERMLADHHAIIRSGLAAHRGREVDTQGDAFFAVFSSPAACVAAVLTMQQALQAHAWPGGEQVRVRMGVHTGQASQTATGLVGLDVHRAARLRGVLVPAIGVHCRGDSRGYSSDSASAITALEKHGRVDRSTWSSTRVRTLRR